MSIVLHALGIIVNSIFGVVPDFTVNITASVLYDNIKKIYDMITIRKGRNLKMLHPVIETALINSFYNAIILSLTKTKDYYKTTSNYIYKKEILQISSRMKDLNKLLKSQSSSSGYSLILDNFCEAIVNGTEDNTNHLLMIAKNNLIGLPEKAKLDLENNFIGIFLILFKEKFVSDDILKSLLTFDILKSNLNISIDTNKKIDSLICSHVNIENELNSIASTVSNLPTNNDFSEIHSMLNGIQNTLTQLLQSDEYLSSYNILVERSYLDIIYNKYRYVELPSFDGSKKRIPIKNIYSPLELLNRIAVTIDSDGKIIKMPISEINEYTASNTTNNPFIIERMSIYDIFLRNKKAFIVGNNGTGKSITAQHLLCCLSCYQSDEANYWSEQRIKFGLNDLDEIPIYISLLDYYQYNKFGRGANSILSYLQNTFSLHENLLEYLNQKLLTGKVIIIVEDCNWKDIYSSLVLSDLSDFLSNYSRCRYLIFRDTSNDHYYNKYSIFDDIPKFELSKLNPKTMRNMADKYCSALSSFYDISNFSFEYFLKRINEIGLNALLEKPYWFVMLLMMDYTFNELPNSTYNTYIKIVDNMLSRLFYLLDNFSEMDKQNVISAFELLSVKLFSAATDGTTLSIDDAKRIFEKYLTSDKTSVLIDKIKSNNCELLTYNLNDSIIFVHKPLISAIVTRYYKYNISSISTLIDYTIKNPDIWMESLGLLFDEKNYDLLAFVLFMIQNASCVKNKDVCGKISLGVISKVNVKDFIVRPERIALVKAALQIGNELIDSGKLSISDRLSISEDLSLISSENAFNIDIDTYFKLIPAGIVILGNDKLTIGGPYEYNITYDYYAAKFPVTNFEYQQFLSENSEYPIPSDEINIWNINTRCVDKRFLNHPVVGVDFYDALKYCQWLNSKLDVPNGYKVWLPSDPEWMKMYRGGKEIQGKANTISDRIYPWGNDWIDGYANLSKLKEPIFATTPVGIFVEGISVFGCYDTCGNVLEWTTTSWGGLNPETPEYTHPYNPLDGRENLESPGLRITRGGSFLFSEGDAKCSCRLEPESKFPDTGFRIFLVPDRKSIK